MAKVKQMPYSEKYTNVLDYIKHESLAPSFIKKHMGDEAAAEFPKICQEGVRPIPEHGSFS